MPGDFYKITNIADLSSDHIYRSSLMQARLDCVYESTKRTADQSVNSWDNHRWRMIMKHEIDLEHLISLLYKIFLNREAGVNEIDFHIQGYLSGLNFAEIIGGIAYSEEAKNLNNIKDIELKEKLRCELSVDQMRSRKVELLDEDQSELICTIYNLAFSRRPAQNEIDEWKKHLSGTLSVTDFVHQIATSEERIQINNILTSSTAFTTSKIIQIAFQEILKTGINRTDIEYYSEAVRLNIISMSNLITQLFKRRLEQLASAHGPSNAEPTIYMLGTNNIIPLSNWYAPPQTTEVTHFTRTIPRQSQGHKVQISAIASMYKGEKYIASFLENITSQTIFEDSCELIIVDACSPQNEIDIIRPYMERFSNIKYHRTSERIGIYNAWNIGIKMAKGEYITNTNMDDLRRLDSFEIQYKCFERVGIPDVVYQDFLYSFEDKLSFEEIQRRNIRCRLPIITVNNLTVFNSPHNAPMWRRSLHDDVGWFDERYQSAGDCDFWLRCALAGKTFYKINDPHVAYYWNPTGLSTGAETLGVIEHRDIMKELGPNLVPRELLMSYEDFRNSLELGNCAPPLSTSRYGLVQSKLLSLDTIYSNYDKAK